MIISYDKAKELVWETLKRHAPSDAKISVGSFGTTTVALNRGWACDASLDIKVDAVLGRPREVYEGGRRLAGLYCLYDVKMSTNACSTDRNIGETVALVKSLEQLVTLMGFVTAAFRGYQIAELDLVSPPENPER